jgi:hypothetical protein
MLPRDIIATIALLLEYEDIIHLRLTCKQFALTWKDSIFKMQREIASKNVLDIDEEIVYEALKLEPNQNLPYSKYQLPTGSLHRTILINTRAELTQDTVKKDLQRVKFKLAQYFKVYFHEWPWQSKSIRIGKTRSIGLLEKWLESTTKRDRYMFFLDGKYVTWHELEQIEVLKNIITACILQIQ